MAALDQQVKQRWRITYKWALKGDTDIKRKCVVIAMLEKENNSYCSCHLENYE